MCVAFRLSADSPMEWLFPKCVHDVWAWASRNDTQLARVKHEKEIKEMQKLLKKCADKLTFLESRTTTINYLAQSQEPAEEQWSSSSKCNGAAAMEECSN